MIDSYCSEFHLQLEEWEYDMYADELADCVKRFGLHPGKIMIFPQNNGEVTDHLPLRVLGNEVVTTGVNYHQIYGLLCDIDIFPHNLLELLCELEKGQVVCSVTFLLLTDWSLRIFQKTKKDAFC